MGVLEVEPLTPNEGRAARFTPQGLAEDGFVPTTYFQLADVRNYGRTEAQKAGESAVRFKVKWTHQFESYVTVSSEGFILDSEADLSTDQLWRELEKIHG